MGMSVLAFGASVSCAWW